MKRVALLALVLVVLNGPRAWAQSDSRVQFPQGRTHVTLKGQVGAAKKDYAFFARAGQRMSVHLTSTKGKARFNVIRTKYDVPYEGMEEPLEGAKEMSDWSGTLPEDGDYHVYIFSTTDEDDSYTLEVTILHGKVSAAEFEGLFELQGKAPKGLEGFKSIVLTTLNFTSQGAVPVKPTGNLRAGALYKMARITINGENLSFETVAVKGVSYQFTGTLSMENAANPSDPSASFLKGQLSRSLNGKRVAEADVTLESVEGVD
jgi:hypothetical protein